MTTTHLSFESYDELLDAINKVEEGLYHIKRMLPSYFQNESGKNDSTISVAEYIVDKIMNMKSHSFLNRGVPYSKNTILNWMKFSKVWTSFTENIDCKRMTFNEITISTYYSFMSYCDSLSFKASTKFLYATLLKAALSYAYADGVSKNTLFSNRNFKTHESSDAHLHIYLTKSEIQKIENVKLDTKSTLDKVRDIFLIGCYTGQRVSDYSTLSMDDIETVEMNGVKYQVIKKKQKKTGNIVVIPILNSGVIRILNKWNGKLPIVGMSTINSRIKIICRLAGITDTVKQYATVGGETGEIQTTKDRCVSSHTARRSCITNLYLEKKLDIVQIRSISGHKSEQAFYRYLCYSPEECAKQIIECIKQ